MGITARMNRLFAPAAITEVETGLLHSSGLALQQENQLKQVAPVP